jgi:hypothetical protein
MREVDMRTGLEDHSEVFADLTMSEEHKHCFLVRIANFQQRKVVGLHHLAGMRHTYRPMRQPG